MFFSLRFRSVLDQRDVFPEQNKLVTILKLFQKMYFLEKCIIDVMHLSYNLNLVLEFIPDIDAHISKTKFYKQFSQYHNM